MLLAGPVVGLVFMLSTDFHPLVIPMKEIVVVEGPPFSIEPVMLETPQVWREDLFFAILGLLIAGLVVYLLEDLRRNNQRYCLWAADSPQFRGLGLAKMKDSTPPTEDAQD